MSAKLRAAPLDITPVILAGGAGTRLRPLTAPTRPKPFLKLFSGRSLLQHTAQRTAHLNPPVVICDQAFAARAASELDEVGLFSTIIGEPMARGTAAAITMAALSLKEEDKPILVMPSDHYIVDVDAFHAAVKKAHIALEVDPLVILGVPPSGPQTRYGYILTSGGALKRFAEKPDAAQARKFLAQGDCFWNSGIFLTRPSYFLSLIKTHAPNVLKSTEDAFEHAERTPGKIKIETYRYKNIRSLSVDRAVMEKIDRAKIIPLDAGWSDVGSWPELISVKSGLMQKKMRISSAR